MGIGFMALMAVLIWAIPRPLITLFLDDSAGQCHVIGLAVASSASPRFSSSSMARRWSAPGMLRGLHDTRGPMIFTFIGYWLVGIGFGIVAGVQRRLGRGRHLDRAGARPGHRRGADARALGPPRDGIGLPAPGSTP